MVRVELDKIEEGGVEGRGWPNISAMLVVLKS